MNCKSCTEGMQIHGSSSLSLCLYSKQFFSYVFKVFHFPRDRRIKGCHTLDSSLTLYPSKNPNYVKILKSITPVNPLYTANPFSLLEKTPFLLARRSSCFYWLKRNIHLQGHSLEGDDTEAGF